MQVTQTAMQHDEFLRSKSIHKGEWLSSGASDQQT